MRREDFGARLERIEASLQSIDHSMDRVEVATMVREPSTGLAADAYEGLRRQVVAAAAERTAHLVQLARFAEAVRTGDTGALPLLVEDWLRQAGVERREDPTDDACFDVLDTDDPGAPRTVLRPAYVDAATSRPVLMGQASTSVADRQSV